MANIFDLPLHTLTDKILTKIHYIERLKIESTCQLFKIYTPYNDIKKLALDDPIFNNSIHFLDEKSKCLCSAHYVENGMHRHELFANRLEKLFNLLMLRKRIGPRLEGICFHRCVINAEAMRLTAVHCTNLTFELRFEAVVVTEKDAIMIHLPSIKVGELRRMYLHQLQLPLVLDENEKVELAMAVNRFATGASGLVKFVWSDVQLPFPDVPLGRCMETIWIADNDKKNPFPAKIDLSNFARNSDRLQEFSVKLECCVSLPSYIAVLQITTLRSLMLKLPIKISGSNTNYSLTQADVNAIGNLKNLETLELLLYQTHFFYGAGNQPQLLNLKPIGLLPQLQDLQLILGGRESLSFTQLEHLLWTVPLKMLDIAFCFEYFVDEFDIEASDADDILDIIARRVGGTLTELWLDESNAMKNWAALALRQKLAKFGLFKIRNVDFELLKHFGSLPSMSDLLLSSKSLADGLRFTSSHFETIAAARNTNGHQMNQLCLRLIDFVWENQQEIEKISQEFLKLNVKLLLHSDEIS